MKKINAIGLVLVILTIFTALGFIFYWKEYRPSQIRKKCYDSAIESSGIMDRFNINQSQMSRREDLNFYYQNCLKMNGLEK